MHLLPGNQTRKLVIRHLFQVSFAIIFGIVCQLGYTNSKLDTLKNILSNVLWYSKVYSYFWCEATQSAYRKCTEMQFCPPTHKIE